MFFSHFVSCGFLIPSFSAFPCFFASPLFPACLLLCFLRFPASAFLLLRFSASLNFCFCAFVFLLLCLSASPLFCFSLLFQLPCFSAFSVSLLTCFYAFPCFFCFSYCRYPKKHHATHKPYEAALTKCI